MLRLSQLFLFGLLLFASANTACAEPTQEASAILDRWAAAFSAKDIDAMLKLYAPDAVLFGVASPKLYQGNAAIRAYYAHAPGIGRKLTLEERHLATTGADVVTAVGFYRIDLLDGGQVVPRSARFTFVIVKRDGHWIIAHQHDSVLPPAPLQ